MLSAESREIIFLPIFLSDRELEDLNEVQDRALNLGKMEGRILTFRKLYGYKAYVREVSPPPKIAQNKVQESSIFGTTETFSDWCVATLSNPKNPVASPETE